MKIKAIVGMIFWCVFCIVIAVPVVYGESFDDFRNRTEKQREDDNSSSSSSDDNGSCDGFGSCLGIMCNIMTSSSSTDSSSDDDYNSDTAGDSGSTDTSGVDESCIMPDSGVLTEIAVKSGYMFGQDYPIYSFGALADVSVMMLNANIYYNLLSDLQSAPLYVISGNVGFSLPLDNFIASVYGGFFYFMEYLSLSFGSSLKVKFTENLVFTFYSLFAFEKTLFYMILNTSLNFRFDFMSIGVGFDFNSYNAFTTFGPVFKVALWL